MRAHIGAWLGFTMFTARALGLHVANAHLRTPTCLMALPHEPELFSLSLLTRETRF